MLVTKANQLPNLRAAKALAFDLETDDPGLKELGPGVRRDGKVLGMAVAVEGRKAWYIPTTVPRCWEWWNDLVIHDPERPILGANITYYLDYAAQNGATIPATVRDLLHAGRLLNLQGKFPSLDELLVKYLGVRKTGDALWQWLAEHRGAGAPTRRAQINHLKLAPDALVGEYAEGDVVELFDLLKILEGRLKERCAWEWYLVESELLPYLLKMRRRGIRVDVEKAHTIQKSFGDEYAALLEKFGGEAYPDLWDKLVPAEKIDLLNANSGASLAKVYEKRGVVLPQTPTGMPSVTKGWLKEQDDPFSKMVLRLRALSKVSGTFVDSYILKHQVNGRIHPELNQLFPRTLRMSGQNPNEQNIPSRDEVLAPLIRGLFLPDEGEMWGRLDYSQQEYRLVTHFGRGQGAEAARQAYRDNPQTDFHELVGMWLAAGGHTLPRKTIKNANFSKVYRAGKQKFADTLGVDRAEGDRIFALYDRLLPWVKITAALAEQIAENRGYIQLILKDMRMYFDHWAVDDWDLRRAAPGNSVFARTFETREEAEEAGRKVAEEAEYKGRVKIRKADVYKALNRLIQPSGAQLLKHGMVLIARSGVTTVLGPALVSVHDELGFSVPRTREGVEAFQEAVRCLERSDEGKMSVPLTIGVESGPSWGALEEGAPRHKKLARMPK